MIMTDKEKLDDGLIAFSHFISMLDGPNDIYKEIVLMTLFQELFGYDIKSEFQEEAE